MASWAVRSSFTQWPQFLNLNSELNSVPTPSATSVDPSPNVNSNNVNENVDSNDSNLTHVHTQFIFNISNKYLINFQGFYTNKC